MNPPIRKRYSNNSGGHRRSSNRTHTGHSGHSAHSGHSSRDGGRSSSGGAPRPRKNFRALQEKFLNQAKDAMSSGDRILAEYYLQHADHYYRMNEEFLAERAEHQEKRNAKRATSQQDDGDDSDDSQDDQQTDDDMDSDEAEDASRFDSNSSSLPSFITSGGKAAKEGVKVVNLQEWDD